MINCEKAARILPEYVGKSTTKRQNAEIALHVSLCPECLGELAFWFSVKKATKADEMPNFAAVFDRLPTKRTKLQKILESSSPGMAFDLIRYVYGVINDTYKLAGLAIQS